MATRTQPTLRAQVEALTAVVATLAERMSVQAPAISAPVQASAQAPLYVSDKPACAIHPAGACTRKLSHPEASHEACAGKGDPMHDRLRPSHRHF